MILRILVEVILAVATFIVGYLFWQLIERAKFLRRAVCNQPYLEGYISAESALESAPADNTVRRTK